ncbi:MAG: nucleotidyltransferase domain-containing protein [Actinomycetia bacterium]|nr:nucleotidyltransferase domain-containing protein [Actinomycetes bacterium]
MRLDAPRRAMNIDDVRRHREQIVEIGRRFGVRNIRVFGSVARGDAVANSDLDLLIDVDPGHGYFDMAGLRSRSRIYSGFSPRSRRSAG